MSTDPSPLPTVTVDGLLCVLSGIMRDGQTIVERRMELTHLVAYVRSLPDEMRREIAGAAIEDTPLASAIVGATEWSRNYQEFLSQAGARVTDLERALATEKSRAEAAESRAATAEEKGRREAYEDAIEIVSDELAGEEPETHLVSILVSLRYAIDAHCEKDDVPSRVDCPKCGKPMILETPDRGLHCTSCPESP